MTAKYLNKENLLNILIGLFLIITYVLGLLNPISSDAGKYAAISRIIYETGDWINLEIHYEPYLQKPPLLFWITTPFFYLLGPTSFAFKLPVLLYSGIGIYSVYRFTKLYYGEKTGRLAALFTATSEFFFLFHNDIHMDSLLAANAIFAIWQFAEYTNSKRLMNAVLAGVGIGLALISKGPIGAFVPITAILFHLILKKQLRLLISYKILVALIVTAIILFAGLIGTINQFGWEGVRFFIWDNNAGRISGKLKGSSTDYLFYIHTTLYIFLPWGFLFFIALFQEFRKYFQQRFKPKKEDELLSLGAIFFYWIVISVAKAKAPHYLMILMPFMAVLTAKWIYNIFSNNAFPGLKKIASVTQAIIIVLTWLISAILCILCFPSQSILFWGSMSVLIIISLLKYNRKQLSALVTRSVIAVVAFNFALNANIFPQIFTNQSVIAACKVFNSKAEKGEELNSYLSEHRELFFYAKYPGHFLYDSDDLKNCLPKTNDWIYTNDKGLEEIKNSGYSYKLIRSFKHTSISKLTIKYINPKTRSESLRNMHLIKLTH